MDQERKAFNYLREKFPRLSDTKDKEGIFVRSQIREVVKNTFFDQALKGIEKDTWEAFKWRVHGFLGNRRYDNYNLLVKVLLQKYHQLGCNMSQKSIFSTLTSLKWELSVMSTEKDSIRIILWWNGDIRTIGIKQCLQITAGLYLGMPQKRLTRDKSKKTFSWFPLCPLTRCPFFSYLNFTFINQKWKWTNVLYVRLTNKYV